MESNRLLRKFFIISWIFSAIFLGGFSGYVVCTLLELRSVLILEDYSPSLPTSLYDIEGRLIYRFFSEKREICDYNEIPPSLIRSLVAVEDEKFFLHYGINPWRILKALYTDVTKFRLEQGGSTISTQLSKILFLHYRKEFQRKIRELWYTMQIERLYSKKEILYFYLNQINYGHGCHGVKVASKFFLNKSLGELDLSEIALLVGIPKAPSYYSPLRQINNSMKRHQLILRVMEQKKLLPNSSAAKLYEDFWVVYLPKIRRAQTTVFEQEENHAPYFVEYIRSRLEKTFGKERVYRGGLNVYTTLDLKYQEAAKTSLQRALKKQNQYFQYRQERIQKFLDETIDPAVRNWANIFGFTDLKKYEDLRKKKTIRRKIKENLSQELHHFSILFGPDKMRFVLNLLLEDENNSTLEKAEGALIAINPESGHVKAMIGGSGFTHKNQLNRAIQAKRQIGSVIKPFIYAAALDQKVITPATILKDAPLVVGSGLVGEDPYMPKNYSGKFRGNVSAKDALSRSINVVAIQVLDMISIPTATEYLNKIFRVTTKEEQIQKFPANHTMVFGTGSFSPFDLGMGFSVFANEGRAVTPKTIRYVTDRKGKVIWSSEQQTISSVQILSPGVAYIINQMLSGVFQYGGTAFFPELLENFTHKNVSAGKTGTTSNWKDAWFVGYNKELVTTVWIGMDNNRSLGVNHSGAVLAAPVWIQFNKKILKDIPVRKFVRPQGVIRVSICPDSGDLFSSFCDNRLYENFLIEASPEKVCNHKNFQNVGEADFIKKIRQRRSPKLSVRNWNKIIQQTESTPEEK